MANSDQDILLNYSTYSGADIRAVLNVYEDREVEIDNSRRIEEISNRLIEIRSRTTSLEKVAKSFHLGDEGLQRVFQTLSDLNAERDTLANVIEELVLQTKKVPTVKTLAEIQTLSISTHREKFPVRSFGTIGPKGFCRGARSIAGSIIFTVFDRQVLSELLNRERKSDGDQFNFSHFSLADQLPPFDITIVAANEYGQESRMALLGVELVNEGMTMSIQDIFTESVCQYVARDLEPLNTTIARTGFDSSGNVTRKFLHQSESGRALLQDPKYMLEQINLRRNPFI